MAFQKNIISDRTGGLLVYHEVAQVIITAQGTSITILSYPDKAARDAGKQPSDTSTIKTPNTVLNKGALDWAQDQVLAAEGPFKGGSAV